MAKIVNLARMTTATTGTGTITLVAPVAPFLSFANAGVSDGDTVSYAIKDGSNSETGRGVYTSSGTTLTRSVIKSTNSNNAISLSGSAEVALTPLAEDLLITATPGGRLTLTTATPVLTSTTSAQTTVYYTPYVHQFVPLYDGTSYALHNIGGELSQATTDTTKSPAACTTNSNYDLFVWIDSGTYRCTRGPAWSSSSSRGTGAGTTELERVKGVILNKVAITNGPAANRGTYVGTIRTNGSSQVDWIYGAAADGGTAASFGVWNMYNRVSIATAVSDTTNSWTYNSTTWRPLNNSTTNAAFAVCGWQEDMFDATHIMWGSCMATGVTSTVGIGVGSTSTPSGIRSSVTYIAASYLDASFSPSGTFSQFIVAAAASNWLGWSYFQALEACNNAITANFYGDAGQTQPLVGLIAKFRL